MYNKKDLEDLREKAHQLFPDKEDSSYLAFVERLEAGEPIAYILEYIDFFGNKLFINKNVLIPRVETEILLEKACNVIKKSNYQNKTLLDLCCGSGALGLGAKREFSGLSVILSDVSSLAIKVVQKNAQSNHLDVQYKQGDFLENIENHSVDILLCNPPYVSNKEYVTLEPQVVHFEPKQALVGGEDGLLFYRRAESELPRVLKKGAKLFFEIGYSQGERVFQIFSHNKWLNKKIYKDWSGLDRFFFLEIQ